MKFRQIKNCLLSSCFPQFTGWAVGLVKDHSQQSPVRPELPPLEPTPVPFRPPGLWVRDQGCTWTQHHSSVSYVHLDSAFLPFGIQSAKPRLDCLIEVYRSCQEILAHQKAASMSP